MGVLSLACFLCSCIFLVASKELYIATSSEGLSMHIRTLMYALYEYPDTEVKMNFVKSKNYAEPFCVLDIINIVNYTGVRPSCDSSTIPSLFFNARRCMFMNFHGVFSKPANNWQTRPYAWNTPFFHSNTSSRPFDISKDTCVATRATHWVSFVRDHYKFFVEPAGYIAEKVFSMPWVLQKFVGIHWRQGDKLRECEYFGTIKTNVNCWSTEQLCNAKAINPGTVFIATDASDDSVILLKKCGYITRLDIPFYKNFNQQERFIAEVFILSLSEKAVCGKSTNVCEIEKIFRVALSHRRLRTEHA